ncbi:MULTISPECIES: hypothetical protein [Clostridium]|uniref:Uncharacterized protein n=1 Tax=Clostridium butyricum TaxID=1492 RepID=A0A6N3CRZ7_CLOBU|nr:MULTISPECIES: hypothetical protein [Clostridium]KIU07710.1 hypothetical protein SC08_Contig83orf01631 [Clostridium butyricum]MBA8967540.1 hypothetical protein [Clostridium butyricum]MBA8971393.1 hypothetical protein [Clostridium butyricum]MDB2139999.1 hypothetical protein [Clostridium butyricum]MDB2154588.1 hypothetical protein [Clostridium butyricum]
MEIYKVIKIISDSEILINAGANKKLAQGTSLDIFITGEEIFDPDTNESLGTLDTVKATVEVDTVYPQMALCKKIEYSTTNLIESISNSMNVKKVKRLKIDPSEISGGLSSDLTIHIGDLVRTSLG